MRIDDDSPLMGNLLEPPPLTTQPHDSSVHQDRHSCVGPSLTDAWLQANPHLTTSSMTRPDTNRCPLSLGSDPFNLGPLILKSSTVQTHKNYLQHHRRRRRVNRVRRSTRPSVGAKRHHDFPDPESSSHARKRQHLEFAERSILSTAAAEHSQPCRTP